MELGVLGVSAIGIKALPIGRAFIPRLLTIGIKFNAVKPLYIDVEMERVEFAEWIKLIWLFFDPYANKIASLPAQSVYANDVGVYSLIHN